MKTSIKVLITIMSIAIVGLTIGLFVAMQPKEVEKVYVSSLQVLPGDDNLVDISIEGEDYKTYAINLNNTASFAFKYVATPEDLSEYTISVITDNSAILEAKSKNKKFWKK